MAYGLKYKLRVGSLKYANDVVIEILKDGYSGESYDKYLGSGGINLSKEDGGVINGTSLKFSIQADSNLEYLDFFELPTRTFQVQLKVNNVVIWIGYIVSEEYSEQFIDPPYDVQVHAVDGLGLLKTEPYVIESSASTRVSRLQVIQKILDTIALTMPIIISYDVSVTSNSANIFTGALFADDYYEGWNCYDVLEKMIPPDATITQHEANWYIRRNGRDSEKVHTKYTWNGSSYVVSSVNGETALSLAPKNTGVVYPVGSPAEMQIEKAWKSLKLRSEHGKRPSWLRNNNFSMGFDYWTETNAVAGTTSTYLLDGVGYIMMQHYTGGVLASNGIVHQSVPFTATPFILSFKHCLLGYDRIESGQYIPAGSDVRVRISVTDGVSTYYWWKFEPWSTNEKIITSRVTSAPFQLDWKTITLDVPAPPISGTLKVELLRPNNPLGSNVNAEFSVCFTDINIQIHAEEVNSSIEYILPIRDNATETADVTVMPTDGENVDNFDSLFFNVHQTGGAIITSFTDGAVTSNWVNLMINNLVFLHGVSRQIISGRFRGVGLTLNSVITCTATTNRKYFIKSGTWNLYDDSIDGEFVEIPGSATGSSWAIGTTDWSSYGEQSNQQTTPQGGGTTSNVNLPGLSGGGTSWLEQYFEIINPGTQGEFLRCIKTIASERDIIAYSVDDVPTSLWDALPIASATVLGGVKIGSGLSIDDNGVVTALGSGVTDHGALTGLADDDHPQYLNNFRGDARYQAIDSALTEIAALYAGDGSGTPVRGGGVWALEEYVPVSDLSGYLNTRQPKDADLTAIASITETVGYLKKTAANTWTLVNSTFLTAITKEMIEAQLTGQITTHSHAYEAAITKSVGYLRWTGSAWEFKNEAYSLSAHNHAGTYEPAFSKNTAFNKNFGTEAGTVTEGNDSRLSDARTPLSHTHGNLTNDGKIGVVSGKPIITSAAGVLTTGSFGSAAGTFAQGNDSRFHTHANESNLNEINQDLGTGDDVHFLSADVTSLEVDNIVDGVLQTGFGTNLLKYSNLFENAVWTKYNCTAYDNNAENPFGGDTIKAAFLLWDSSSPVCQQTITHSGTGNYTFSVWLRADTEHTAYMRVISSAQTPAATAILIKNTWQRFSVTYNFTSAHTTKSVRIELGNEDIFIFGAQLEGWEAPTRYINTGSAGVSETGVHAYGDLRVNGSIVAADEVTAFSDARLKHDIRETTPALQRLMEVNVVDYVMNGDKTGKLRTGVIAQQILPLFPQMVEGSEADYLSVNYEKLVSVAIKAIQELNEKVKRLENILAENGISE